MTARISFIPGKTGSRVVRSKRRRNLTDNREALLYYNRCAARKFIRWLRVFERTAPSAPFKGMRPILNGGATPPNSGVLPNGMMRKIPLLFEEGWTRQ